MASSDTPAATKTTRKPTSFSSSSSMAAVADRASWYCAVVLLGLILMASVRESSLSHDHEAFRGSRLLDRPCDEIYVVGEGETLHTISDKCNDPFIVERNPHIHDPDDVFPGLVIKITPCSDRSR
ncbi:LysM domain containing protein [Parasponia andersonii]|uniref:LysM domain containing protein n=1 Tax=Parasponia andersonii TaxID=3476 RepID=A0A2P5D9G2_PARAD|nr:LysM domain containing protein [Parasponia andersonii]